MRAHPKITWLKDHEFGSITICPENAGWWRAQSPTVHDHRTSAGVGLVGVAIGAKWTLLGTIYGVISVGFYTVWGEIESWTEPLIIEVHSEIILDPGEKLTFYTLEGEAMLRRVGQENGVTLPAGKMLAVRGEGDLGPPTDFSRSELPDELEVLAREVEAAEPNYELSGTAASASSSGARRKDDGLSAGAIVAIVLGALLVAGGLGAYVVLLIRRSLRP
jgi:hypothetical protein